MKSLTRRELWRGLILINRVIGFCVLAYLCAMAVFLALFAVAMDQM